MFKRLFILIVFIGNTITAYTNEMAVNFMLMNNYDARQLTDLWSRIRAGFKLSHTETRRVRYYEKLYTKNPKIFSKRMNAAKPYLYYILNEVERFGAPSELVLLAGVESFYNPQAKSSSNAYGMWQFLPGTGKRFNLEQNNDIDERQDIVKSTDAALAYLLYLYALFGKWELAIGAYNSGEGAMFRVVKKTGKNSRELEYDDLELREETQNYVPKLIALANIIENPKRFGVELENIPNEPFFAITNTLGDTNLNALIELAGVDDKVFDKLNPQYKSKDYQVTRKNNILLPVANQQAYYASINNDKNNQFQNKTKSEIELAANQEQLFLKENSEKIDDSSDAFQYVNLDDTKVAETKNSPTKIMREELDDLITNLSVNETIPKPGLQNAASKIDVNSSDLEVKYTVNPGDTLYSIAKKFNVEVDDIRASNKIPGNNLTSGQVLTIRQDSAANSPKIRS